MSPGRRKTKLNKKSKLFLNYRKALEPINKIEFFKNFTHMSRIVRRILLIYDAIKLIT